MKRNLSILAMLFGTSILVFSGCQRKNNNVQAAREERAAGESAKPADNSAAVDKNVFSPEDRNTAFKIEQANMSEIDLGRLAQEKAQNKDVNSFAKMMVDEHTDALKKLQKILDDKHVDRSASSKAPEESKDMEKLQAASGADFDREFMNIMVEDHQKDLGELKSAEASVTNPDLKDNIHDLISTVQNHLDKAHDIQSKMNMSSAR